MYIQDHGGYLKTTEIKTENKSGRKMNEAGYVLHLDISDAKNLKFKVKLPYIMFAISFTTAPYIGFHQ